MKKLIITIAILLLSIASFAQTPHQFGNGKTGTQWNDSLYCGGTVAGDSVYTIDLNLEYEWMKIFIKGNANNTVDSLKITEGAPTFSNLTLQPTGETIWGSYVALKDSGLNTVNVMVNNTVGKSFTLWNPAIGTYKMEFLNYWATNKTRKMSFVIIAKKK